VLSFDFLDVVGGFDGSNDSAVTGAPLTFHWKHPCGKAIDDVVDLIIRQRLALGW
jgi:hypothetical protein